MKKDTYMLDEKGQLFRKGEKIGEVQDGTLILQPQFKQYVAPVTRWLNEQKDIEASEPAPEITEKPKLTPQQQEAADLKGITSEGLEDAKAYKADLRDDEAFAEKSNGKVPPPPKKNPQFGDKTPAYVEWLHRYRPDKFHAKYINKGKGKIPTFKRNPETGVDEFDGYKEVDFTLRKTHMTEKVQTGSNIGDDQDWDA